MTTDNTQRGCCGECGNPKYDKCDGCPCHTEKKCCAFCTKDGDYEIRKCAKCPCHKPEKAVQEGTNYVDSLTPEERKRQVELEKTIIHTSTAAPAQEGWEKDFDKKFPAVTSIETKENGTWSLNYDGHEIKSWFRNLLASEIAKEKLSRTRLRLDDFAKICREEGAKAERARLRDAKIDEKDV